MIFQLFGFFFFKHLVADFLLQPPYMYKNKGTYGHSGGLLHVMLHGWFTFMVFAILDVPAAPIAYGIVIAEMLIHYHIDWAKMNLNRVMGWAPNTSEYFWMLLGVDQFLHLMTYLWMVWMLT